MQNSLADTLGFNRLLEYEKGFYESNYIFNILGVDNVCKVNDLVQGSYVNGVADNVIYSFSPNVEPGF